MALQSAALIQGTAVRCGPGIRLVSWPETPSVRAAAISRCFDGDGIAVHRTAAWIWGATRDPGQILEFTIVRGRVHDRPRDDGVRMHQYQIREAQVSRVGGLAVTTPLRTVYDLLRATEFGRTERLACRTILVRLPTGREDLREFLSGTPRPYNRRVLQRLEAL